MTATHGGRVLTVPLSRVDFENLTRDLLVRTRFTTQELLRRAGVGWEQVERVLLVGGSTHMPMTRQMLQDLSGKAPDQSLAVSEVVVRGAALHAGIRSAHGHDSQLHLEAAAVDALAQVVEINVNAHSLGIEVKQQDDRVNDVLIPKNTQLPTAASRVYRTVAENQSKVRVKVLQGDARQTEACIGIGECWIEGLPPSLPKGRRCRCAAASAATG